MKLQKIREGEADLWIPKERVYEASVFYNPAAVFSRDVSIAALQTFVNGMKKKVSVCDALAASGVRGIRYAKEVRGVKSAVLNDKNPLAVKVIKKNIRENRLSRKCKANKADINYYLYSGVVFDYIDIDPFGPPVLFLDSAARSIFHRGFCGITATDTAALSGTYPLACLRKYGIRSMRTPFYAELGLRILLSHAIMVFAKHGRAFMPRVCFADRHYFRVFGSIGQREGITELLRQFGHVMSCKCGSFETGEQKEKCFCGKKFGISGPVYLGKMQDKGFCEKTAKEIEKRRFGPDRLKLVRMLKDEADFPPFYFDLHRILKGEIPKIQDVIDRLERKGFRAARTAFCRTAVRTDADFREFMKIVS